MSVAAAAAAASAAVDAATAEPAVVGGKPALRVLVTRPADQAADWVDALRARSLDAVALPLIGIAPADDPAPVTAAWAGLQRLDLVFFVSPNAVRQFFARRLAVGVSSDPAVSTGSSGTEDPDDGVEPISPGSSGTQDLDDGAEPMWPADDPWPPGLRFASPGPGTSRALREAGVPASRLVEPPADAPQFDSEALWAVLGGEDWRGRRVLVVRGDGGRDWLATRWTEAGASVAFVAAYRRARARLSPEERVRLADAIAAPRRHLWFFSSSEAVDHLLALTSGHAVDDDGADAADAVGADEAAGDGDGPAADWRTSTALATHPRIVERAVAAGFGRVVDCRPTVEAVAACIESLASPGADGAEKV